MKRRTRSLVRKPQGKSFLEKLGFGVSTDWVTVSCLAYVKLRSNTEIYYFIWQFASLLKQNVLHDASDASFAAIPFCLEPGFERVLQ